MLVLSGIPRVTTVLTTAKDIATERANDPHIQRRSRTYLKRVLLADPLVINANLYGPACPTQGLHGSGARDQALIFFLFRCPKLHWRSSISKPPGSQPSPSHITYDLRIFSANEYCCSAQR